MRSQGVWGAFAGVVHVGCAGTEPREIKPLKMVGERVPHIKSRVMRVRVASSKTAIVPVFLVDRF